MSPAVAAAQSRLVGGDIADAVKAAAELGNDRSTASLKALIDGLATGLHPEVAEAALEALARRRSPTALPVLELYARHRSPAVRARALAAIAGLDDRRADRLLIAALSDGDRAVRAAAAEGLAARKSRAAVEPLMALLIKGDEAAALALSALADPEVARAVAETIGRAPDAVVARCLGAILSRPTFKPDSARLEVVRALGRVPGDEALEELTHYVSSIPERPPRASRAEAEKLIDARLSGVPK